MEEFAELIVELLKTHNRVSLPGLGAFVATPQAAAINSSAKTIAPPSKKIAFSKAETWNDGLLEQLYAERHDLSLEEARDRLRHIIVDIRFELDAAGKLTLPGLGTLRQSQAREIDFGLSKNLNLKSDSYGLGEVKIAPKADAFRMNAVSPERGIPRPAEAGNNLPQLILLGVMLVIISALLLYLFLRYRSGKDDLVSSYASEQPAAAAAASTPPPQPQPEPQRIVHTPLPATVQPAAPKQPQPAAAASPRCEHCVIATSLSTQEGARLKANAYRQMGYKAEVIHSGGNRYRVAIGCYRDAEAARQQQRKVRQQVKDAWVLEVCK